MRSNPALVGYCQPELHDNGGNACVEGPARSWTEALDGVFLPGRFGSGWLAINELIEQTKAAVSQDLRHW